MTCTHGMLSPKSCIDCMNEDGLGAEPVEPTTVTHVFPAKFEGHCNECNLPMAPGQRIAALSNGRYVHEGCS